MGIETVAVYSEADRKFPFTYTAGGEAIRIGPAPSESYLNMEQIISATIVSGTLSIRDSDFCRKMIDLQLYVSSVILFSSTNGDVIRKLGNKSNARNTMIAAGVLVIPEARNLVMQKKHWPLQKKWGIRSLLERPLVVAKGMHVAYHQDELENAFHDSPEGVHGSFWR